jgi:HEAT repeat protein
VEESAAPLTHAVALPPLDDAFFTSGNASSGLVPVGVFDRSPGQTFERASGNPSGNPLVQHLMTVLDFINATIENMDSALLIVLDEWDRILHQPGCDDIKEFFADWLGRLTERKNAHLMLVVAARTEGESYTLGGAIYNHFRTKLLLDPLGEVVCRKWSRSVLQDLDVSEEVNRRIFRLSKGSPYWHFKALHYLRERLESNRLKHADSAFFDKLGIDTIESLPELGFTCLKLTFLNDEDSLYKVIAALIKRFGEDDFSVNEAIRELSPAQGFTDGYVFEVLRSLYRHDFIRQLPGEARPGSGDAESPADGGRLLSGVRRRPPEDPRYVIQGRLMLAFLQEKTRAIETDISADEKLAYLKKIIPLSIKSGDLDREKTMEILALGDALGYPEIVSFLEALFMDALQDEQAIVRVTALNNMALIDSPKAREALLAAMRDNHAMVREAVADNLALLSRKNSDPALTERIIEVLIRCIDDESDMVRTQVYSILSRVRGHRDLTTVFVKGLSDACESVRLIAVRNLAELDTDSPYAFGGLLDAVGDSVPDVRRYACVGLQKYPVAEAIEAIARLLRQDPHSGVRALAADTLSRMEDSRAFPSMVAALRTETAEDVKLAVVRALGKRRDWQAEVVLQETLKTADSDAMPVFVWAAVRSLGQVGGSERSLELLGELQRRLENPIILNALNKAQRTIRERLDEFQQHNRPKGEAPSLTVSLSGGEEEDITLPEEEMLPS